jgi:methylated-DNA-protein-cysteine methyltransferase-like protein
MKNKIGLFESVYEKVFQIPFGRVATYGQIAELIESPCDARLVGWALASLGNRREELPIPWHRVVGKGGKISLPGSEQRMLLEREGIVFDGNGQIDLGCYGWNGPGSDL